MKTSAITSPWQMLERQHAFQGFAFGCRYPSILFGMHGQDLSSGVRNALWQTLTRSCPALTAQQPPDLSGKLTWQQSLQWLLSVWQSLQEAQGMVVFETGRILAVDQNKANCLVPVAAEAHKAMAVVVQSTVKWLAAYDIAGVSESTPEADAELTKAIKALANFAAKGSNVPRFVKAGYQMGVPITQLPGGAFQYGQCSRARWLDSSFTDATPTIAAGFARNKALASALLAQAGFPVSPHLRASTLEAALLAAHRLGYPVVVKPGDLDGGIGVAAGLETDEEVKAAFDAASKHSRHILVEKHNPGKDYRLTVFQGELIWAIERIPGSVTGDGKSTVTQLIDQVNTDPKRGDGKHAPLKRLQLDQEAKQLLMRQGLDESGVPKKGQFVRLRRAANVASGGQPVAVYDKVHPDNARLAVRAAELLRLDLAGIDLLIEDVSKSWRDPGSQAAICEINGQPNLGQTTASHLYGQILKRLVPGCGRVPTFMILGAAEPNLWLHALSRELRAQGYRTGVVGPEGISVDDDVLHLGALQCLAAGRMLTLDRSVDAVVMAISESSLLDTGLPWERYDALLLGGKKLPSDQRHDSEPKSVSTLQRWLGNLLPACDGFLMTLKTAGVRIAGTEKVSQAKWLEVDGDPASVAKQLVQQVTHSCRKRDELKSQ